MATAIHPSAIIHEGAELADGVVVGPYCIVSGLAKIGPGTKLVSHVIIEDRTTIGANCEIHPFSVLGGPPQDLKYKGEPTELVIGSGNIIKEYVSIHRASVGGDMKTTLGDNNFVMGYVHIAHDCKIGSNVIMTNYTGLAGHVTIEDKVVIGGHAGFKQFTRVGMCAMVGGMARVVQDIPPFTIVAGYEKVKLYGLNLVGLRRNKFADETIAELKKAYAILFKDGLSRKDAILKIQEELPYSDEIKHMVEFIQASKGIVSRAAGKDDSFSL